MTRTSMRPGRSARAALLAVGAALASASPAFAYGGGTAASVSPPVHPGTQTPAEAWKLMGQGASSSTLVAPRWVLTSGHAPDVPGRTTVKFPDGQVANPLEFYSLFEGPPNIDLSLSLLDRPITPPADGFPLLVSGGMTEDLSTVLPGWVQWAGYGGWTTLADPIVGWTKPDGTPPAGGPTITQINGDSGSTGFLYRTPSARPLIAGISVSKSGPLTFGGRPFSTPFDLPVPASTEAPATTIKGWLQEQFAKHPEAAPPTWTTLAAQGYDVSTLPAAAPARFRATSATSTSVSLAWDAPTDTRIAHTGYRVRVNPGNQLRTLPASATSTGFTGLTSGTDYTFSIKAYNSHGESPTSTLRPDTFTYGLRTVSAVPNLASTPSRVLKQAGSSGTVDYCLDTTWSPASTDAGTIERYEVRIDGAVVNPAGSSEVPEPSIQPRPNGTLGVQTCGLQADRAHTVSVVAKSGLSVGPSSSISARTMAGDPLGTPLSGVRDASATTRRSTLTGKADYCFTLNWTAPTPVVGFPVKGYAIRVFSGPEDDEGILPWLGTEDDLSPSAGSYEACGLHRSFSFRAEIVARYAGSAEVAASVRGTTPSGAPRGTLLGAPASPSAVASKQLSLFGEASYCLKSTWLAPAPVEGFPVLRYGISITAGSLVAKSQTGISPSTRSHFVCGLNPSTSYVVNVYAEYGDTGSPAQALATATTPAGAPAGTIAAPPAGVAVTTLVRTGEDGQPEYCATVTWQAGAPLDGFPVTNYGVSIDTPAGQNDAWVDGIPATGRRVVLCGLTGSTTYHAIVYAKYPNSLFPRTGGAEFTTPA